jgi:glutamate synthase (ferredoxin)
MGEDTPLAFLAQRPRVLYDYFKQRFAQVTNPPIDPLREGCVMSLDTFLGRKGNILQPTEDDARQIKLESPVLTETMLETVMSTETIPNAVVSLLHKKDENLSLEARLSKVVDDAVQKV